MTKTKRARDVRRGDNILVGKVGGLDQAFMRVVSAETRGEDVFIAVEKINEAGVLDLPPVGMFDNVDVEVPQ